MVCTGQVCQVGGALCQTVAHGAHIHPEESARVKLRMITAASLITGGACWILRWVLPRFDLAEADPLGVAGTVLISLGVAGIGARLVRSGMLPLRLLVSVASVLLVLSLLEVLHSVGDEIVIDAILGVLAFVVAALTLRGESARKGDPSRHRLAR